MISITTTVTLRTGTEDNRPVNFNLILGGGEEEWRLLSADFIRPLLKYSVKISKITYQLFKIVQYIYLFVLNDEFNNETVAKKFLILEKFKIVILTLLS